MLNDSDLDCLRTMMGVYGCVTIRLPDESLWTVVLMDESTQIDLEAAVEVIVKEYCNHIGPMIFKINSARHQAGQQKYIQDQCVIAECMIEAMAQSIFLAVEFGDMVVDAWGNSEDAVIRRWQCMTDRELVEYRRRYRAQWQSREETT